MEIWPGNRYPFGATFDGTGTTFAIFSEVATRVQLCPFDQGGTETLGDLYEVDAHVWQGYAPDIESSLE